MKIFLLSLFILACGQRVFAEDLGKKVNAYVDNTGPKIGVAFAYDVDTIWVFSAAIWGGDALTNSTMKTLAWRLFNSKNGNYINSWTTAVDNSSAVTYPGTITFSWSLEGKKEALAAIAAMSDLKMVLSVDQHLAAPKPTHFIDLGSYCNSNPSNFSNLTTGRSGCAAD